jgi:hypothetical protein
MRAGIVFARARYLSPFTTRTGDRSRGAALIGVIGVLDSLIGYRSG